MAYFFDILFSIKAVVDGELGTEFQIIPTANCKRQLARYGLRFKHLNGTALIIAEKQGIDKVAALPLKAINEVIDFSFLLVLKKLALMNKIQPYKRPSNSPFPPFTGRSRKLYLNNLDGTFSIDNNNTELAAGAVVSDSDLGSVTPTNFGYTERDNSISLNQITLTEVHPNGQVILPYDPTSNNRTVQLNLTDGAYQLRRGPNTEIWFAQTDLLRSNALGIIQIFKDSTVDYNQDINYEISFTT